MQGDSPVEARLNRGGGLDHVCYFVDDLDEELAAEVESGARWSYAHRRMPSLLDRDIAFVHRRSGLVVELMTRTPVRR